MGKSISEVVLAALAEAQLTTCKLLQFTDGSNTYRYTDLDVPIYYTTDSTASYMFTPRGFKFESINYSMGQIIDDASLSIDNLDQVMTSIFVGGVVEGKKATLWLCVIDSDNHILDTVQLFDGLIGGFDIDETEVNMTVLPVFVKWNQSAHSYCSASCRWKVFKGTECQYADSVTTCDRSYPRCKELGNTNNFGGFRWLLALQNKSIQWGPTEYEAKHPNR